MAISKIMHMNDCGNAFHGMHLKRSLAYVMAPEKTQNKRLIRGMNCHPENAYLEMRETKRRFQKTDKRQGYHIVLSFKEGEVDPDTALEITEKFVREYLGERYEAVYTVHDNTTHVHSHIIFNSVSFLDGKKYHYAKGDWERKIQPITNRLCQEYGLSVIALGKDDEREEKVQHRSIHQETAFIWSDMIKRDLDACMLQAYDFEKFLMLLSARGYEIKRGKYLALRPPGMERFRRCKTLGEGYSEEEIRKRIAQNDSSVRQIFRTQEESTEQERPHIVRCYVRRYRRAKLSGIQKQYFRKLYKLGQLKKRPYSQVWKYKDELKKMQRLQEGYLFLCRHNIHSEEELSSVLFHLEEKRKEASKEKGRLFRERAKLSILFEIANEMENLHPAENSYQDGDTFFQAEHVRWETLKKKLLEYGYTCEEVLGLQAFYGNACKQAGKSEAFYIRELKLCKTVAGDMGKEITKERDRDLKEAALSQKELRQPQR